MNDVAHPGPSRSPESRLQRMNEVFRRADVAEALVRKRDAMNLEARFDRRTDDRAHRQISLRIDALIRKRVLRVPRAFAFDVVVHEPAEGRGPDGADPGEAQRGRRRLEIDRTNPSV